MLTPVSTNTMTITIAKAITNYNDYNNKILTITTIFTIKN